MAQDAELKLKVSLDLGFFRQQLAGLGQAAAGYNIPVQVKFDRRSVQNELNALGANIRRRNYFLEVKTNLKSEIDNAATLAKALTELERLGQKTKGAANRAVTGAGTGTSAVDAAKFQSMVNRATKPALESLYAQMAKAKIPMGDVGKGTVAELRAAIISGVPRITQDIAQGLANGLDPKLKENGSKGAKLFIDAFKDASGIASPSKVFKQIGEFSADGLEIGFINGLKDFKNKAVAEIKKIAALMKLELASVGDVRIGAGIGAIRGGVRGGTQYGAPIGPLQTGSREPWGRGTRGMYGGGGFEPYMAGAGRQLPAAFTRIPGISPTTSTANMLGVGLPALPAAGMSSAAGMRQAELFAREAAARARSAERGLAVMQENAIASRVSGQVPLGGGGPFLPPGGPPSGPTGGGGGLGGFGQFGRAMGGINLPGTGTIRELGSEFAFAAKQVLLFGTAYKALAFIQDFPGQVGQAVSQLQSFNNTLKAVTPSAEEARASNEAILNLVEKYNVPLQSARDGFTKLYASMSPAGFSGEQIRGLFTGITKAAATFGMSADKVDRVNYAFAQMASKGQVMSEELKGQLGDVLPGAMAIFAEAAGFKGPDAIQKFSAALEEGRYKGQAMVALLNNVNIVMNAKFAKGAEGAAKTFQGAINNMQTSLTMFYQAFEPVAVQFLSGFVSPVSSGLKVITDGLNAFFKGTAAKTGGGFAIAQQLNSLRPAFEGIRANLAALIEQFGGFTKVALEAGKVLLEIAGNPVVGYFARVYANVLLLTTAVRLLNLQALVPMITNLARSAYALIAFTVQCARAGQGAQVMGLMVKTAGITLRTFFASTGVGLVLVGLGLLIERFMTLNQRLEETKQKAAGAAQAIRGMSSVEARTAEQTYGSFARSLEGLNKELEEGKLKGKAWIAVSKQQADALKAAGVMTSNVRGQEQVQPFRIGGAYQQLLRMKGEAEYRRNQLSFEEKQTAVQLAPIPPSEGDSSGRRAKPKFYISTKSPEIESELNRRLAAVEANTNLNTREKEIRKANLTEFAKHAIAKEELDARLLQIEKAGYVNRQKAIDDANAQYQKSIGEASFEKEKVLFGPILDAIEQETKATALAAIQQELYGNDLEANNDLLEAEYLIRTTLDVLKGKDAKRGQELAQILRDQIKLRIQDANAAKYQKTVSEELLKPLQNEIALLRAVNDEERRRLELLQKYPNLKQSDLNKVMDLEKVRDNLKQVRQLVDDFVTSTSSDYKGFLKAVISGEDAADALRQFQEGLSDRVLTIFLDFTMKPVEQFFKDTFSKIFTDTFVPKTGLEGQPSTKPSTSAIEAADKNTTSTDKNTLAIDNLTAAITTQGGGGQAATNFAQGIIGSFGIDRSGLGANFPQGLEALQSTEQSMAGLNIQLPALSENLNNLSYSAGIAAPETTGLTTSLGAMNESLKETANEAGKQGANFSQALGKTVQGIGIAAGAVMSIAGGIKQIEKGDTASVLGGIGSILMGVGGAIGGFMNLGKAANGAVWKGGFRAFANGGTVQGPTLGLIGEGKYNEAIVPLPDGKSIPVQMRGGSLRDEMQQKGLNTVAPTLSFKFESTTINGVEYVSRQQLEEAMMTTRRQAARDGAKRGMTMTLDKLQQSPSTRRQIGI